MAGYASSRFGRGVARGLRRRLPVLAFRSADRALLLDCRARPAFSRRIVLESSLQGQSPHAVVREQVLITVRPLMAHGYLRLSCSQASSDSRTAPFPTRRLVVGS